MLAVAAPAQSTLHVIREVKHDVSPPLAELARLTPAQPNPFSLRVLNVLPTGPAPPAPQYALKDTALQVRALTLVAATVGLNFEGLGLGQYGFVLQHAPARQQQDPLSGKQCGEHVGDEVHQEMAEHVGHQIPAP